MECPHGKDLRKGRVSIPGQVYVITTVTLERKAVFRDIDNARILVRVLMEHQALGRADTLCFVVMPDHLHWVMRLGNDRGLSQVVRSLKAVTSARAERQTPSIRSLSLSGGDVSRWEARARSSFTILDRADLPTRGEDPQRGPSSHRLGCCRKHG